MFANLAQLLKQSRAGVDDRIPMMRRQRLVRVKIHDFPIAQTGKQRLAAGAGVRLDRVSDLRGQNKSSRRLNLVYIHHLAVPQHGQEDHFVGLVVQPLQFFHGHGPDIQIVEDGPADGKEFQPERIFFGFFVLRHKAPFPERAQSMMDAADRLPAKFTQTGQGESSGVFSERFNQNEAFFQ